MQMEEMIICQRLIILDMQELVQIGKKVFKTGFDQNYNVNYSFW